MSESDRLRAMLDELGIEHHDYDKGGRTQTLWEAPDMERYFCFETEADSKTSRLTISWFPTAEQAIAATLGSDRLTAEQVQHAIERHFGKVAVLDDGEPVEWRDDWVCKVGIDYRGIAAELNAEFGVTQWDERIAELEMNWNAAKDSANRWRERCIEFESRCYELESLVRDMRDEINAEAGNAQRRLEMRERMRELGVVIL